MGGKSKEKESSKSDKKKGNQKPKLESKFSMVSANDVEVDPEGDREDGPMTGGLLNVNKRRDDKYTTNYRLAKTALLILAWISLGVNLELIGPTFEDLKIFIGVDYSALSFGLILRNVAYLSLTVLFGLVLDKFSAYSELMMAVSSAIMALASIIIPITRIYFVSMSCFLAQGLAQAIYDMVGNNMILNLWSGISTSPINAMHAGYGIGAILAVQASKNYIVFSVYDSFLAKSGGAMQSNATNSSSDNNSSNLLPTSTKAATSEKIDLKIPYFFAALIATVLTLLFLIAQLYERKIQKDYIKTQTKLNHLSEDFELHSYSKPNQQHESSKAGDDKQSKIGTFLKTLFFGDRQFATKWLLAYFYIQTALLIIVFIFNQGFFTVITRFMLTYLVLGPAKFNIESFSTINTLFWAFFIVGRFIAAYVAFHMDSLKFFFYVLLMNMFFGASLMIPFLTNYRVFFWIVISALGLTTGPMTPTGFMIAKHILDINSFILSLLIVGLALGGTIFQQVTAGFLDYFKPMDGWMGFANPHPSYVIPHVAFLSGILCFLFFVPVVVLFRRFNK